MTSFNESRLNSRPNALTGLNALRDNSGDELPRRPMQPVKTRFGFCGTALTGGMYFSLDVRCLVPHA